MGLNNQLSGQWQSKQYNISKTDNDVQGHDMCIEDAREEVGCGINEDVETGVSQNKE